MLKRSQRMPERKYGMITLDQLGTLFPLTPLSTLERFLPALNRVCAKYEINNRWRISAFLAQIGHESGGFRILQENLNYSSERLQVVFPNYFPPKYAVLIQECARNPEKIANRVYANRMGNGPPESGDGYKFRGRGLIQLTGKENYQAFAESINKTLDETVEYLTTPDGAVESAGWFWNNIKANRYADVDEFSRITKLINGGLNGNAERLKLYRKALSIFT